MLAWIGKRLRNCSLRQPVNCSNDCTQKPLTTFLLVFRIRTYQLLEIPMKKSLLREVTACLFLGLITVAQAQNDNAAHDPFDPNKVEIVEKETPAKQIRVQVEFIDVSHEQFTELMFGPKPPANDGELRKQVAQLVKDGKATVVETLLCTARNGQKATSESIEEFIYPTEYEPATLPDKIDVKPTDTTGKTEGTRPDPAVGPTPTAFSTRNLGSTLEIEPTLRDDLKTIDLHFIPEIVYHVGNEIWGEWKGEHGNSPVQMPTFYAIRTNTSVTLDNGHYMLTAALSPKSKEGKPDFTRKLMIFVKADVITTGP